MSRNPEKFYVTTPIYYVNDIPHIGHAYTTIAADILARYNRFSGRKVFFLTGTDEHGQKVQKAAEQRSLSPKEHADKMVVNFKEMWQRLNISNNAFIRTTDEGHKARVRELLSSLWGKGLIEKRSYTGWYCVPDERFWTEKDLVNGKCPDCGRDVEQIEEQNYFFLMSRYHDALIKHIEKNPSYVQPDTRRNEVLGFLKYQPLGDLCISRPKKRLPWGIPLPFDEEFVTYVWFDALVNYYSGPQYLASADTAWWPADVHIIGKDILTTHAVYWSTMLMALGLPLPGTIFAHGWWTIEGRKMSKSLGNVVDPADVVRAFGERGVDTFRYFLFREIPFGHDGDFSKKALEIRNNKELANDLGNLISRTFTMTSKYFSGLVPQAEIEPEMKTLAHSIPEKVELHLKSLQFQKALEEIWNLVSYTNNYIQSNEPWTLAKSPEMHGRLAQVIYSSLEAIKLLAAYLYPFMPSWSEALWKALGYTDALTKNSLGNLIKTPLPAGRKLEEFKTLLFPIASYAETAHDVDVVAGYAFVGKKEERKKKVEEKPAAKPKIEQPINEGLIGIEDFAKVKLRTAKVLLAEPVKGSNKLIRLEVDLGDEKRQIVAGIGKSYSPEELIGKTVVIVANLKPAKLMGVESNGMLLAATDAEGTLSALTTEKEVKPGASIK
ncbi:MAG: methionine--tRNA ligase [Nitrospiraceae bacterium]|nr:methionine--tRNA ligase [Nitrospiraceae bacterium]